MKTLEDLLVDFPYNWDVQLHVCCHGVTDDGPRRWSAIAIPKPPTLKEALANRITKLKRQEVQCCDTPTEAVELLQQLVIEEET